MGEPSPEADEGGEVDSGTDEPVHRFGKPLPPGPSTLADAIGVGLRGALRGPGLLWLPLVVWVAVVSRHFETVLLVGSSVVLLVGTLWAEMTRVWRVAVLLCTVAAAGAAASNMHVSLSDWVVTVLLAVFVVPRRRVAHWAIPAAVAATCRQAYLMRSVAVEFEFWSGPVRWIERAPVSAASSLSLNLSYVALASGLFVAARSRSHRVLTVVCALAVFAHLGVVPHFESVRAVRPSLLVGLLVPVVVGWIARHEARSIGSYGDAIAWIQRRPWTRGLLVSAGTIWVGAQLFEVPFSVSITVQGEAHGIFLVTVLLTCLGGLGIATGLATFLGVFSRTHDVFDRCSIVVVPICVVAALLASDPVLRPALSGWSEEIASAVGRVAAGALCGAAVGRLLALVLRRPSAALLAVLVFITLWHSPAPTPALPGATRLALRVGLLSLVVCWGAVTHSRHQRLTAWLAVAGALAFVENLPAILSRPGEDYWGRPWAASSTSGLNMWATSFGTTAYWISLYALSGFLIAQAIHFARAFGSMTPIPAWHPVRADFERDGRDADG